jgi:hypothetical protein
VIDTPDRRVSRGNAYSTLARRCICSALVGRPGRRDLRGTSPCSGCRRSQSRTSSNNQRGCLVPGTLYAGGTRPGARHRSATSVARSRWSKCANPSRSSTGPIGDDAKGEPLNGSGDCIGRTPSCSSRQAADGIAYSDASGAVALIAGCAPHGGRQCADSRFPVRLAQSLRIVCANFRNCDGFGVPDNLPLFGGPYTRPCCPPIPCGALHAARSCPADVVAENHEETSAPAKGADLCRPPVWSCDVAGGEPRHGSSRGGGRCAPPARQVLDALSPGMVFVTGRRCRASCCRDPARR